MLNGLMIQWSIGLTLTYIPWNFIGLALELRTSPAFWSRESPVDSVAEQTPASRAPASTCTGA